MYLVCVYHGYVLTHQESGDAKGATVGHAGDRGDAEKWLLESGDKPDMVAMKNLATGKYLTAEPRWKGDVSAGDKKQWWQISRESGKVRPPGAFRLSLPEEPKYFLTVCNGRGFWQGQTGWRMIMYDWSETTHEDKTWYFADTDGSYGMTKSKATEDREASLAKTQKDIAAKEKQLDDQKKELQDREAALARREEESTSGKKALEDREATLAKRQRDTTKALEDRETAFGKKEDSHLADQKAFRDREAAFAQKAEGYSANEQALKKREAALAQKEKDQVAEWDKKMKELEALQKSSAQPKTSPPSNALPQGCGYKHYKPPRKLKRKIVGLLYET